MKNTELAHILCGFVIAWAMIGACVLFAGWIAKNPMDNKKKKRPRAFSSQFCCGQ